MEHRVVEIAATLQPLPTANRFLVHRLNAALLIPPIGLPGTSHSTLAVLLKSVGHDAGASFTSC